MEWSPLQQAIFDDVADGEDHTVVVARAGTGKTTTILEALSHVPGGCRTLMVAFNKGIAREMGARAPKGVWVKTLHSYGLGAIRREYGDVAVDEHKSRKILADLYPQVSRAHRTAAVRVAALAKGHLLPTQENRRAGRGAMHGDVLGLIDRAWQIADFDSDEERQLCAEMVVELLEVSRDLDASKMSIDFDDMVWLPVAEHLSTFKNDRVFVDEAQDLNRAQHELVAMSVKRSGRMCAVGDDKQAIYGFRGADRSSLDKIRRMFSANTLPLSITYRCPRSVVALVKHIVPDFEACEGAPEGLVEDCGEAAMLEGVKSGDFILSRVNAPLIRLCLRFIRDKRRASIVGRNIGKGLAKLIEKSKKESVPELLKWIAGWSQKETTRLLSRDPDADVQQVRDRRACLEALSEGAQNVGEVLERIDVMFADGDPTDAITLSSTHRAKGLERDVVWMLRDTYLRSPQDEEKNLFYVAATRAKRELHLVRGVG